MRHAPLDAAHRALGAKMVPFGGWEMPLEYPAGVLKEHAAVRESVGIFDVSHLGKAEVRGPGAAAYVNRTLTNDLGRIHPGKAQYTLCCADASGGIVDDLIAYLHADDYVFLIPNAANTTEVVRRLVAGAPDELTITDQHDDYAIFAVQGTRSDEVLDAIGLPTGHEYMSFAMAELGGAQITVCRTGYTGERGYELVVPADAAAAAWDELMQAGAPWGIQPCGLGARDTLRTEMGYPLHGQDSSLDITPTQGRVGWAVGWKKPEFWGRDPLLAEREAGPGRVLRGLKAEGRGIPRPHMQVTSEAGAPVGEITSGTFSPTLRTGIALALLATEVAEGDRVLVDVRGRGEPFTVVKPPFVDPSVRES